MRKPTRGPAARNASAIEPECATQATCPGHERLGPRDRAEPERDAAGRRDAHAVRADDGDVALGRARGDARRDRAPLGAGLGAEAGQHDGAHAGGDDVLERGLGARVPDEQERALGRLGQRRQRREALAPEHAWAGSG